ncbi:DUF962-domain-containing protein [Viridothelium virens]|uniref:DUF962-domain-containing protein n=1 Tax=Viridothelium virens TaxID=1048519 RepID=A0A6A6HKV2_VIRVR|nr:DUF962-domain-containing protein [Viridothelium virens]
MALNLEKQLLFYGSYHHDPVNVGIHITCVPLILMTAFLLGTNSLHFELPSGLSIPYLPLNLGTAAATVYTTFYILLEPVAGAMIAPFIMGGAAYSSHLTSKYGATANYWAIGIQIVSWAAQFIGHGVFEGRAPALLDNLLQAFLLAPFFVWLEVLFFFGYRPELKSRLDKSVEQEVAKLKASQKKEKANGTTNGFTR